MLSETDQSQSNQYGRLPSYAVPRVTDSRETDSRLVAAGPGGRVWGRELVGVSWAQFLFYKKNVLGGGGCTTM